MSARRTASLPSVTKGDREARRKPDARGESCGGISMKTLEYVRVEDQLPDQVAAPGGTLDSSTLVGTWFATDKQATGVVRLELREQDGTLFVRAFGADPGQPNDWGEIEATAY